MAISARYHKMRETEFVVEYEFGGTGPMDRRLMFDKDDRTLLVDDGRRDHLTIAVALGILRRLRVDGEWPRGGGVDH
ncbi:hypothetical protein [Dactylosporangium matsuzakiense]|uniref:Uncharacterized protein n=1 Tax=Dactylosporangium matsuzakiense TaxID=53360 RepID=A0A9W6NTF7_9ACTN|nr:hypothetical protein [Dactylosporangium matsuzakiense]GLL08157.1 hypothetical protein GCM10017581_099170 [Dactylosporangium matsuzakiense]